MQANNIHSTLEDDYHNAMFETHEIFRVDLSSFVCRLPVSYVDKLYPPTAGVYMEGSIHPFITFGNGECYYSHQANRQKHSKPDIFCFDDVWKSPGIIYDIEGRAVFCVRPGFNGLPVDKHLYTEYPRYHTGAIYIAFIYALEYFRWMAPNSTMYSEIDRDKCTYHAWVKQEYLPRYETYDQYIHSRLAGHFDDEENEDLITLRDKLAAFLGNYRNHVHRFFLHGTVLTIERGNDWRVIEYYRHIKDHLQHVQ